jgi:hypothetical protein
MIASQPEKQKIGESCHAYDRDGNSRHQVPYKDKKRVGEFRNTTIKDIRENGWLPSVSSILSVMAKKGLDGWIKEQVAQASWEIGTNGWRMKEGDLDERERWINVVLEQAEARMTRARDLGTGIHASIEKYLELVDWAKRDIALEEKGHYAYIEAARNALTELGVWGQPFESERTFASPLGYGGTVDFSAGMLMADFKCVDRLDKKLDYPDRCAQLCAYCTGTRESVMNGQKIDDFYTISQCRLVNIFISTSEPGKYLIHECSTEEKEHGWALFSACFTLWKVVNRYDPSSPEPPKTSLG